MERSGFDIIEDIARGSVDYGVAIEDIFARGTDALYRLIDLGGPIVTVLICLSFVTVTLILFKIIQFAALGVGRRRNVELATEAWLSGSREDGYDIASRNRSPVAIVLAHAMRGLTKAGSANAIVREDIERVMIEQLSHLRAMLRSLELIGQIAPLIGLLGTVVGMIQAFQQMQQAGSSVDPSMLAGGIWVALLTTAVGLAIAIPTTMIASWLDERVDRERIAMERFVTAVFTEQLTDEARETEHVATGARAGTPAHAH